MVLAQPAHDHEEQPVRIGILTGGGDCPGLNAVIRSVVRTATTHYGSEVVGFRDGWRGLLEDRTTPLDVPAVDGLLTRGGTTLRLGPRGTGEAAHRDRPDDGRPGPARRRRAPPDRRRGHADRRLPALAGRRPGG